MRSYWYNGQWVDEEEYAFLKSDPSQLRRSDLAAPRINSDTMPAVQSMADGKVYDSKSRIRETYKPSGNRDGIAYTEIGNDPAWRRMERPQPKSDKKAIQHALRKAESQVRLTKYTRDCPKAVV